MDANTIDVMPREYGFGRLKLTERIFMGIQQKGEAFFGRMIGLYDVATNFNTDIEALDTPHKRADLFRTINIWVDNSPRAIRNAHSRICGDFPGVGKDDVLDINLDLAEVEKWADYQKEAIETSQAIHKFYTELWGKDFVQMGIDLHFNIKSLNLIRQWMELPSWEIRYITRKTVETLAREGMFQAYIDGEDLAPFKKKAIDIWADNEKKLLSVSAAERTEEHFND